MQRLILVFCILALSSVSHISAQTSCTTSEQCTDAEIAPICRNGVCSTCNESLSEECLERSPNAPICSQGGCYPCLTSGDYAPECGILFPATPICSNDTGSCRACAADTECGIYGETIRCQDGACIGLDENSGLIIAVCFIAAIVAVIIALILYARLRKKKDKKGTTSATNAANNMNNNNNNASVKNSARTASGTNKDVPMTEVTKEPIAVGSSHSREDSSESSEASSSNSRSAPQKSASEQPASSADSSESEESAEESSESSSASSSEGEQQSSAESSAQSSS